MDRPPVETVRSSASLRGWQVVLGAFLVTLVGFGAIYSYAVFADEIASDFGSSRSDVTLIFVLSGASCYFVSAVSGMLADRIGPSILASIGMALVGLGLMVAGTSKSLIEVYVGYGLLIGLGVGFAYVPALAAVQRWFLAHRGLASGIAVSGVGIGTALVPPAAEALALLGDWRIAFLVCGVLAIAVGIGGATLLHPSPERFGLGPDGALLGAQAPSARPEQDIWVMLRGRAFLLSYLGTLLVSVPVSVPYALLVATARDLGVERHDAVALLALIGFGSIAGRFVLAALADVIGRRAVFLGSCAGVAAATLGWSHADNLAQLQAFALVFGALQGGFVALLPAFIADSFGRNAVGAVIGLLYTSRGIALLAGPTAVTLGIAVFSGHAAPIALLAALGAVGTLLLAKVSRST